MLEPESAFEYLALDWRDKFPASRVAEVDRQFRELLVMYPPSALAALRYDVELFQAWCDERCIPRDRRALSIYTDGD